LLHEVQSGRFRSDLYYRLATSQVALPPLRDRLDDLLPIARAVIAEFTGDRDAIAIDGIVDRLKAHRWPGNVRELRAVMQHFAATGRLELANDARVAQPGPVLQAPVTAYRDARALAMNDFEQQFLTDLISRCEGNASEAARLAGMDRPYLLKLLRRHGLR
jgi:DNA-binding NtrC family response regulator